MALLSGTRAKVFFSGAHPRRTPPFEENPLCEIGWWKYVYSKRKIEKKDVHVLSWWSERGGKREKVRRKRGRQSSTHELKYASITVRTRTGMQNSFFVVTSQPSHKNGFFFCIPSST